MRVYAVNTFSNGRWTMARVFQNLDKLDKVMLACGYVQVLGDSYLWEKEKETGEVLYANVTTLEVE
jgi:hypothetical protein